MSLYIRNPDVPAYRPHPYPKRRPEEETISTAQLRIARALEPAYADFFVSVNEERRRETA